MGNQANEDMVDDFYSLPPTSRTKANLRDYIRTEKLKLLAEVKNSLTQMKELKENRDNKGVLWGSYDVVDLDDIREVLTKLEAELSQTLKEHKEK